MKTKYRFEYKDKTIEGIMEIDLQRFEGQFLKAQYELDSMVMTSMIPFMPKQTGTFINVTQGLSQAIAGSGKVVAAAPPFGRFLYNGLNMVDIETGSPWARAGAKKVLVSQFGGQTNAKETLDFSTHANPNAQPKWFDAAKQADGEKWVKKVKKIGGGGNG